MTWRIAILSFFGESWLQYSVHYLPLHDSLFSTHCKMCCVLQNLLTASNRRVPLTQKLCIPLKLWIVQWGCICSVVKCYVLFKMCLFWYSSYNGVVRWTDFSIEVMFLWISFGSIIKQLYVKPGSYKRNKQIPGNVMHLVRKLVIHI